VQVCVTVDVGGTITVLILGTCHVYSTAYCTPTLQAELTPQLCVSIAVVVLKVASEEGGRDLLVMWPVGSSGQEPSVMSDAARDPCDAVKLHSAANQVIYLISNNL
jgi:hypothetical protein